MCIYADKYIEGDNMKTYLVILIASGALLGCASPGSDDYCKETVSQDDARPNILVIGDSISIAYAPLMEQKLPNYEIVHNLCNARNSANGVKRIDQWLNQRNHWGAITFNHGLWDIASWVHETDKNYARNLHIIAKKIKARTEHPYFVLTTEVLPGTPHRLNSGVLDKNEVALKVMQEEGIPVIDLYTISLGLVNEHVNPTDVHYTEAGSQVLANDIADILNQDL